MTLESSVESEDVGESASYLSLEANRLATFTDSWPFKQGSTCTPEKMAEAGFYYCPDDDNKDLVRCYVCNKELVGWEATDDPWEEHKSHTKKCSFVELGKKEEDMTPEEFLNLKNDALVGAAIRQYWRKVNEATKLYENVVDSVEDSSGVRES